MCGETISALYSGLPSRFGERGRAEGFHTVITKELTDREPDRVLGPLGEVTITVDLSDPLNYTPHPRPLSPKRGEGRKIDKSRLSLGGEEENEVSHPKRGERRKTDISRPPTQTGARGGRPINRGL